MFSRLDSSCFRRKQLLIEKSSGRLFPALAERWQSGLLRTPGKRVLLKATESSNLSLSATRQSFSESFKLFFYLFRLIVVLIWCSMACFCSPFCCVFTSYLISFSVRRIFEAMRAPIRRCFFLSWIHQKWKNCIDQKWKNSEGFRREEDGRERGMRGFIG